MKDVVIVSAVRTPVGKFQGALSEMSAVQLGAVAVREAVRRAGIDATSVDECVMGCVLPAGLGQNPARQAALQGGLADTVSALTINMVCGSGLRAVALAAQSVTAGDAEIVVAGGEARQRLSTRRRSNGRRRGRPRGQAGRRGFCRRAGGARTGFDRLLPADCQRSVSEKPRPPPHPRKCPRSRALALPSHSPLPPRL